jgi:hypothetical protein
MKREWGEDIEVGLGKDADGQSYHSECRNCKYRVKILSQRASESKSESTRRV